MELRAVGERAVLVGHDGVSEREVDPGNLALDSDLSEALHEWARVASAVQRSNPDGAGSAVVSRRGLQLATRLAAIMRMPVGYVDPLTGELSVVDPPEPEPPAERPEQARPATPEPVPWLPGLTVTGFAFLVVLFAILTLSSTLAATRPIVALGSQIVVTAGLLPSVWLVRQTPIWRWIGFGVAGAIALGWVALPFILF
jgi:hypothetical protein